MVLSGTAMATTMQREQQRVEAVGRGEGVPGRPESGREGVVEDRADRHHDEQRQVDEHRVAQRQAPGGALHTASGMSKRRRAQPMASSTTSAMATRTIDTALGAREVVALGQAEDVGRRDLGLEREVARNEDDRAELARRRGRRPARPRPAPTGSTLGRMTRNSTWRRVAPREAAASSISASSSASTGWTLRTQKGRVTKSSATATPSRVPARSTWNGLSTP